MLALTWIASMLSPPPPGPQPVAMVSLGTLSLTISWAYWIDRHRIARL